MSVVWSQLEADLPFLLLEVGFLLLDLVQKHVLYLRLSQKINFDSRGILRELKSQGAILTIFI